MPLTCSCRNNVLSLFYRSRTGWRQRCRATTGHKGDMHMSRARERFRSVISGSTCVLAANIFDPLSARIADMLGYEVCVLSGSVGKASNLGVPDIVLSNMSDVVDHCRSEEHTSELQSRGHLVCRLLLEKKKKNK